MAGDDASDGATEEVEKRTLDVCKDTVFEACAMFEVIEGVLDKRTLNVTLDVRMLDAQELIANLGLLTNRVLGIDGCKGMLSKGVDGCNDIVANELWRKYSLCRSVDRCQDISSGMTIIDVFDVFNGITVIDNGVDRCKSM